MFDITTCKKLNNGVEIPMLGLGVFRSRDGEETENAVKWAIEAGYRHIDTAAAYGNEGSVGKAIRESGVPRAKLFITTKLWNDDMRKDRQLAAFEDSLRKLGTDYIDLYLIHWPVAGKFVESYKVMEKLYAEGRIRAIGVSNFHIHHLETLMAETGIVPAVNQVECHPRLSQRELRAYCEKLGIAVEAWSPLGGDGGKALGDEKILAVAQKHGVSPAQAVLRWDLQSDIITIPKSVHKERIEANRELYGFELDADDMRLIASADIGQRFGADPETFDF